MNSDGNNQTDLTNNSNHDCDPAWSPDGTKIAFSSNRDGSWDIYVMTSDGSDQTNLTGDPANDDAPVWSPDGTKIAFNSDHSGHGEIYVMNADGSNQMKLTSSEHVANYPAWSPDGSEIAFGRATCSWLWSDIYLVNTDGTDLRNITPNIVSSEGPVTTGLTWSPDGTKIAFAGYRPGWNEMHVEIYVMDSDGSNPTRLTLKPGVDSILSLLPAGIVLLLGFLLMFCLPIGIVFLIIWLRRRHRHVISQENYINAKNK
jgi:Tol biopolymer transport system component